MGEVFRVGDFGGIFYWEKIDFGEVLGGYFLIDRGKKNRKIDFSKSIFLKICFFTTLVSFVVSNIIL